MQQVGAALVGAGVELLELAPELLPGLADGGRGVADLEDFLLADDDGVGVAVVVHHCGKHRGLLTRGFGTDVVHRVPRACYLSGESLGELCTADVVVGSVAIFVAGVEGAKRPGRRRRCGW